MPSDFRTVLQELAAGKISIDDAQRLLRIDSFTDLGFAKTDNTRAARQGVAEVLYGEGKTASQIAGICKALRASGQARVLITRLDRQKAEKAALLLDCAFLERGAEGGGVALKACEDGDAASCTREGGGADSYSSQPFFEYFSAARLGVFGGFAPESGQGSIVVAAAGTSDLPVAEEAALTARFLGNKVECLYDVGVAGIHRLLAYEDLLASASVVVAVAGMEGALPSVVAGLVSCPVIAVPTSVGYGASLGGLTALFAMLNSCASGVSVVNIDNGFGAAYQAHLINHVGMDNARG